MEDEQTRLAAALDAKERSLPEDLRELADNARSFAEAEFAYQKARAAYAGGKAKVIAILGVLAAAFAFFALMAVVVGSVIALGPALGVWGAMAAVAGGLLLAVLACVIGIVAAIRRMKIVLRDGNDG